MIKYPESRGFVDSTSSQGLRGHLGAEYMGKFQPGCWGDGKEGGNVLKKKHEVWNTESAL